jgi:predicted metal-dependent enzyme (double-stranded beta helix superfamily)
MSIGIAAGPSLAGLACDIAQDRARWRRAVRFDPEQRYYALLEREPEHEVWLLTWVPGQRTGIHDHGQASGAFTVVQGKLHEAVYSAGGTEHTFERGRARAFGPSHVHDLGNPGPAPAVSIHVYSPLLTTMTRYDVHDGWLVVCSVEQAGADW